MRRLIVGLVGVYFLGLGAVMWIVPETWYDVTPGVAAMGPFNAHFVRDVALTLIVSGLAVMHGARTRNISALACGLGWPACHALFHAAIWIGRGTPFDLVALVNLGAIQLPVWTALALTLSNAKKEIVT